MLWCQRHLNVGHPIVDVSLRKTAGFEERGRALAFPLDTLVKLAAAQTN